MAALPPGWKLPDLRIDVDGDWYDEGIQVTHPGILANLRGNLKKDAEGYFIQTRVRIPVRVDDAPFVLTRIERQGEGLHVVVNDGVGDEVQTVPRGRLPVFAGVADVRGLYQFATTRGDVLRFMPCTCGCAQLGHTSNRSCYVKAESDASVTYTSHAAT